MRQLKKKSFPNSNRGRPSEVEKLLPKLKKLGVFRIIEAKRIGVSQPTLSRLVTKGQIFRLDTGLYIHPATAIKPEEQDYIVACKKFGPRSVVGGLTALFHHHLIEQVPQKIWVMVPYSVKRNSPKYLCVRTKTSPRKGVENHGNYRMTSIERTLVEALRYSSKIGLRVALRATRLAIFEKKTTLRKIYTQAKALKLKTYVERHWEAIVPESQI